MKITLLSFLLAGSSAIAQIPTDNLLCHLKLNSNLTDVTGNVTSTVNGNSSSLGYGANRFGTPNAALTIDNSSLGYADLGDLPLVNPDYTISMWLKFSDYTLGQRKVISKRSACTVGNFFDVTIYSDNTLAFESMAGGSGIANLNYTLALPTDTWIHLAFVVNQTDMTTKFYLNGILSQTTNWSGPLANNTMDNPAGVTIGYSPCVVNSGVDQYNGSMDDLRIYSRSLTTNEVEALAAEVYPVINSNSTLTAFAQTLGTPSAEQSIMVEGTDLTDNITITAPTNYEVSLTSGSGFAGDLALNAIDGTVNSTTIYVRLNAGAIGAHTGDITLTSGSTTELIAISGNTTQNTANLNENSLAQLAIFPNPGSGVITLAASQPTTAVFMSANGAILANLELNGETSIDVSSYAPGIYFICTAEGQTVKFLKY